MLDQGSKKSKHTAVTGLNANKKVLSASKGNLMVNLGPAKILPLSGPIKLIKVPSKPSLNTQSASNSMGDLTKCGAVEDEEGMDDIDLLANSGEDGNYSGLIKTVDEEMIKSNLTVSLSIDGDSINGSIADDSEYRDAESGSVMDWNAPILPHDRPPDT